MRPNPFWDVEDAQVVRTLKLLRDADKAPFLIHCQHGADRTGLMVAMFRIVEQGWSKADAIEEMRKGGFGFHALWRNIPRYINKADVEKIRAAVNS